jgi:hypothetical protein
MNPWKLGLTTKLASFVHSRMTKTSFGTQVFYFHATQNNSQQTLTKKIINMCPHYCPIMHSFDLIKHHPWNSKITFRHSFHQIHSTTRTMNGNFEQEARFVKSPWKMALLYITICTIMFDMQYWTLYSKGPLSVYTMSNHGC